MNKEEQVAMDGSPAMVKISGANGRHYAVIEFQCGPIGEVGENGTTIEAIIRLLENRLEGFQKGKFNSRYNALAITKLQEARLWLGERTADRVARGVEGKNEK